MLHRLPEQHNCLFDHLGRGREEAVLKMVKLDRKVGPTFFSPNLNIDKKDH